MAIDGRGLAAIVLCCFLGGCVDDARAPDRRAGAGVSSQQQGLSDPGIEKSVPIRFVNLSCGGDAATYDTLLGALQATNEVFKAAGMQFALRSVERLCLSNFIDLRPASCGTPGNNGETQRTWANVYQDLAQVFPAVPWNAWPDDTPKTNRLWLKAVETLYGKPEELVVFLSLATSCGNGFWASFPWEGRQVVLNGSSLAGGPYKMAHELGHYFGLNHTFEDNTARDPETNVAHVKSDRWDLHFKPGTSGANPHVFFNSKAQAEAYEASLRRVEIETYYPDGGPGGTPVKVDTCSVTGGVVTCVLGAATQSPDGGISGYTETYSTPAPALKGMGFSFASGQGPNVMSYLGSFASLSSRAFADSDIELMRRHIRWDYELDAARAAEIKPGTIISSRRPQLGAWDTRSPDAKLDFDGDGKRDFGVCPPTTAHVYGQFIVLLSSMGYSTTAGQRIDVQFGQLGDIPVPADYNGDGKADVAVYQPGNGWSRNDPLDNNGYWRWCPTAATPTATSCGHDGAAPSPLAWGSRDSVPLPGLDFDGQANDTELTFYQPATGLWAWLDVGVGYDYRQLGPAGSVPLPGLYDGDFRTDIAVYNPYTAEFQLLRSEQSWNTLIPARSAPSSSRGPPGPPPPGLPPSPSRA